MLHVALQVFHRDNLHRGGSLLIKCFAMCFFFNKTDFLFRPIKVSVVFAVACASNSHVWPCCSCPLTYLRDP